MTKVELRDRKVAGAEVAGMSAVRSTADSPVERCLPLCGEANVCILSVDVEDWFHILDVPTAPSMREWEHLPSRVEPNFLRLLDLFSERDVRVTCFFLGWVAERFPHLAREALRRGHEIAAHGYSHRLVYEMTRQEFLADALRARTVLENITGLPVLGFRASGFSVTERTPWFFDVLREAGYHYDSSVFPAPRNHGGLRNGSLAPHFVGADPSLIEFPITVTRVMGRPWCFFGGGYLRLFPYSLIKRMAAKVLREGRPVVFYIHPREIDPDHPRLPMSFSRRFKSYVNLKSTHRKLSRLLAEFKITSFADYLTLRPMEREGPSGTLAQPSLRSRGRA